jgi:hypothetical protein
MAAGSNWVLAQVIREPVEMSTSQAALGKPNQAAQCQLRPRMLARLEQAAQYGYPRELLVREALDHLPCTRALLLAAVVGKFRSRLVQVIRVRGAS